MTAAVLTRVFGPSDYGLYALTIGTVALCQAGIDQWLGRATIKFVSQAADPEPVGRTILRLHLVVGLAVGLMVAAAAPLLAELFGEDLLTEFIRIFAISIPLETLAQGHVGLLIGTERYRERAIVRSAHWLTRFGLIVTLVLLGFGIVGALWGALSASAVALTLARLWIRPSLVGSHVSVLPILAFGSPLFVAGAAGIAHRRLDLFALKAMGGSAAEAGLYAAAQTLAGVVGILAMALGPLLLSSMNRAWAVGALEEAKTLGRDFFRVALWILPLAGLIAGASSEIMVLVFGADFGSAGPVLSLLFLAGMTFFFGMTCNSAFVVCGNLRAVVFSAVLPLGVVLILFPVLIPGMGSLGAALSTFIASLAGLCLALVLIWRQWGLTLPLGTLLRSAIVTGGAMWVASSWGASLTWLVPKILMGVVGVAASFWVLGEWRDGNLPRVRSMGAEPCP